MAVIHKVKRGDRRPFASSQLTDSNNDPVPLTDATSVTFKMRTREAVVISQPATIFDVDLGIVDYEWQPGDTDIAGQYFAEWEVLWNDGTPETFPTVSFELVYIFGDVDGL